MKWESLSIKELEFYSNSETNLKDLQEALEDVKTDDYSYPACTSFHYCEGRLTVHSPDVEKLVIEKLEREELLQKSIERLKKKVNFIKNALDQLNEDEQIVIDCLVLYPGEFDLNTVQVLVGAKSQSALFRLKRKALIRFYRFFRKQQSTLKQKTVKNHEAIVSLKRQQEKEQLKRQQRKMFIQSIKDQNKKVRN